MDGWLVRIGVGSFQPYTLTIPCHREIPVWSYYPVQWHIEPLLLIAITFPKHIVNMIHVAPWVPLMILSVITTKGTAQASCIFQKPLYQLACETPNFYWPLEESGIILTLGSSWVWYYHVGRVTKGAGLCRHNAVMHSTVDCCGKFVRQAQCITSGRARRREWAWYLINDISKAFVPEYCHPHGEV